MALPNLAQVAEMRRRERVEHEYARIVGDSRLRAAVGEDVLTALCERYEELGGDLDQLIPYDVPQTATVLQYPTTRPKKIWDRLPGESIQHYNARACTALWLSKDATGEIAPGEWEMITPHLLEHNTGFLKGFAQRYVERTRGSFEDYFQACRVGMLEALLRFDPTKGYRLPTYAFHWVKNECENLRKNSRNGLYMPKGQQWTNTHILRGDDEEAKGIAQAQTDSLFAISLEDIAQHRDKRPLTYLETIGERGSIRDAEFTAVAHAFRETLEWKAAEFRSTLTENQKYVFQYRVILPPLVFELLAQDGETTVAGFHATTESLGEIAPHMPKRPLTKERVRQLEKEVLRNAQARGFPIRAHEKWRPHGTKPHEVDVAAIYEDMW